MLDRTHPNRFKIRLGSQHPPRCSMCHNHTDHEYLSILNVPMCIECENKLVNIDPDHPDYLEYVEKLKDALI